MSVRRPAAYSLMEIKRKIAGGEKERFRMLNSVSWGRG
jgi:hypothetical protein